jgi:hypothetical protein
MKEWIWVGARPLGLCALDLDQSETIYNLQIENSSNNNIFSISKNRKFLN